MQTWEGTGSIDSLQRKQEVNRAALWSQCVFGSLWRKPWGVLGCRTLSLSESKGRQFLHWLVEEKELWKTNWLQLMLKLSWKWCVTVPGTKKSFEYADFKANFINCSYFESEKMFASKGKNKSQLILRCLQKCSCAKRNFRNRLFDLTAIVSAWIFFFFLVFRLYFMSGEFCNK